MYIMVKQEPCTPRWPGTWISRRANLTANVDLHKLQVLAVCSTGLIWHCCLFLSRIHFGQISSNQMLLSVIDELRTNTLSKVREIRVSNIWERDLVTRKVFFLSSWPTRSSHPPFLISSSLLLPVCLRTWWASTAPRCSSSSGRSRAKRTWCSSLKPRASWRTRRRGGGRGSGPSWPSPESLWTFWTVCV